MQYIYIYIYIIYVYRKRDKSLREKKRYELFKEMKENEGKKRKQERDMQR